MGVNFDMPDDDMDLEGDDDQLAKQNAMKSLSKHIGADGGGEEEEDSEDNHDYDPEEGAVPQMHYKKKGKKGGGGGGMGGMGGMDIGSMMGGGGGGMMGGM